ERAVRWSGLLITEVVSGQAPGIDMAGEDWARLYSIPSTPFPAAWTDLSYPDARIRRRIDGTLYDANAGHRRNRWMADYAEALLAIWDGRSHGTGSMIRIATDKRLIVVVYRLDRQWGYRWPGRSGNNSTSGTF